MRAQPVDEKAIFRVACCIESAEARGTTCVKCAETTRRSTTEWPPCCGCKRSRRASWSRRWPAAIRRSIGVPFSNFPAPGSVPTSCWRRLAKGGWASCMWRRRRNPSAATWRLKIIKPGMDTREVVARFEAERQALAMMDHPNIAKVFDAGATDAGRPYFAMELVKGTPITKHCDRHQLATRERLELFVTLCQGVQHAASERRDPSRSQAE